MRTQVIAHRGASHDERENTVAAFRLAADMGADAVELDVRRSVDGQLVVHHDPRLADGRAIAGTLTSELPRHIPTLEQALAACEGMWVNVEIKNLPGEDGFDPDLTIADRTMELLQSLDHPDRWLVSCFHPPTIDRCRVVAPAIPTALLAINVPTDIAADLAAAGHAAFHPWAPLVTPEVVGLCHDAGLAINVWTCDNPAQIAELAGWGVDGICTNRPDVAVAVLSSLQERGTTTALRRVGD